MGRIDFTELIMDRHMEEYRKNARAEIAPWLSAPPSNASPESLRAHERAKEAVERQRDTVEDLLVAIQGIQGLNREIESILSNSWPQWAQGIVPGESAARVRARLERARSTRDELEDFAIQLSEGMDPEAARWSPTTQRPEHAAGSPATQIRGRARAEAEGEDVSIPAHTRAIIYINGYDKSGVQQSVQLKRLALFFDEIHYVLPDFWILKDEVLNDPRRVVKEDNGLIRVIDGIDPVQHARPAIGLTLDHLADPLQQVLSALVEHGIAKEYDDYFLKAGLEDRLFDRTKHRLAWQDAKDPVFARLSGTSASDYQTEYIPLQIEYHGDSPFGPSPNGEQSQIIFAIIPPSALLDSVDITTVLYVAHSTSSFPVFLDARHRAEVAQRYQQYQAGLHVLADLAPEAVSPADYRARFGEVAFTLANGVVSSDLMANKSVEDVIKYRSAMDHARRRFLSEHLIKATALVQDNPWSPQTTDELERFIRGELTSDVMRYQDESKATWEKVFGTATTSFAEISKTVLLGGSASMLGQLGGVVGSLIPNSSTWDMLLIASLAGTAQQTPTLVRSIVDAVIDRRQHRRSSIAYVAEFR